MGGGSCTNNNVLIMHDGGCISVLRGDHRIYSVSVLLVKPMISP